jgi:hypothetical protein
MKRLVTFLILILCLPLCAQPLTNLQTGLQLHTGMQLTDSASQLATNGLPVLSGELVVVEYSASSSNFTALGELSTYTNSSGSNVVVTTVDSYEISATINNSGILISGTLTIIGGVGGGGDTTLLTGNLTPGAVLSYGGNQFFQLSFTVSGGSLNGDFGGNGTACTINLNAEFDHSEGDHPFTGSWTSNFDNNGSDSGILNTFKP